MADRRRADARRDRSSCYEGTPDYPSPTGSGSMVERHRITAPGHRAHRDPRADARTATELGAARTTSPRCASSARPASRGTPTPGAGSSSRSAAARCPIINYSGGTEISGGIVGCTHHHAASSPARSPARSRAWPPTWSTTTGSRCAARSASWSIRQPWPGMTRGFWRDPRALPGDLLVALPGRLGPRRLGARSTTTASGTSRAAPTTRSRSPASGSGRPRSSRPPWRTRRWPRPPRSACRTRSRARRSSSSRVVRAGGGAQRAAARRDRRDGRRRAWASRSSRARCTSCRAAQDAQRQDPAPRGAAAYLGVDPGDCQLARGPRHPGADSRVARALAASPLAGQALGQCLFAAPGRGPVSGSARQVSDRALVAAGPADSLLRLRSQPRGRRVAGSAPRAARSSASPGTTSGIGLAEARRGARPSRAPARSRPRVSATRRTPTSIGTRIIASSRSHGQIGVGKAAAVMSWLQICLTISAPPRRA